MWGKEDANKFIIRGYLILRNAYFAKYVFGGNISRSISRILYHLCV